MEFEFNDNLNENDINENDIKILQNYVLNSYK